MVIKDFLAAADVVVDVRATDKTGLLNELSGRAAAALNLPSEVIAPEILRRDELGSTGIGHGVAMPHARLPEVRKPFGLFVRLRSPIEFDAIDGEPVDLVFLLLLPVHAQLEQLNALAAVARRLRSQEFLQKLRQAPDRRALYQMVTG